MKRALRPPIFPKILVQDTETVSKTIPLPVLTVNDQRMKQKGLLYQAKSCTCIFSTNLSIKPRGDKTTRI